jgi:hypothetical protein
MSDDVHVDEGRPAGRRSPSRGQTRAPSAGAGPRRWVGAGWWSLRWRDQSHKGQGSWRELRVADCGLGAATGVTAESTVTLTVTLL